MQGAKFSQVPEAGIEPARYCYHWCLRPTRLPIPPPGLLSTAENLILLDAAKISHFLFIRK